MSRRITALGARRRYDPDGWRADVCDALACCDLKVGETARLLDVSARTLYRWISDDDFLREYVGAK